MRINKTKVKIKRYSSGEMKLLKKDFLPFCQNEIVEIFYNQEEVTIFELYIIVKYFISLEKKVNLTLTYLPYQRMNHNTEKEVATVELIADLFNNLKLNKLTLIETHCEIDNFNNAEKISVIPILYQKLLEKLPFLAEADIFFTDKGGVNRYSKLKKDFIYAKKTRGVGGFIESFEIVGKIKSKSVIIIDDIISTGDTIMTAIENLLKENIENVYIISGHFEKNKYNKRLFDCQNVKLIISTNTLTKRSNNDKLKLYNVWEILK